MSKSKNIKAVDNRKVFKRVKAVTLPTRKMNVDEPAYLTINSIKITKSQNIDKTTGEKLDLPVAQCIDLESGELCEVVLGAALISTLVETYTLEGVNGKSFEITKINKKAGKEYYSYTVFEIDPNEAN